MAEQTNQAISEDNSPRLRTIVAALAAIYVMTFAGGFLQDTQYNFVNYILFALLFAGGIVLMNGTVKSTQTGIAKGFLFLTGTAASLLFIFYLAYEWFRLGGAPDPEASVEAFLYLLTLVFWIGAIGSLVLIRRRQ